VCAHVDAAFAGHAVNTDASFCFPDLDRYVTSAWHSFPADNLVGLAEQRAGVSDAECAHGLHVEDGESRPHINDAANCLRLRVPRLKLDLPVVEARCIYSNVCNAYRAISVMHIADLAVGGRRGAPPVCPLASASLLLTLATR
jgi:hypothetical protein